MAFDISDARFVAHFDCLGMRQAQRINLSLAFRTLRRLAMLNFEVTSLELVLSGTNVQPRRIKDRISSRIFSDTVLLFTEEDSDDDLWAIAVLSAALFHEAFEASVPLRGGVAHGAFLLDEELGVFGGPALIDAYELGEKSQWLGVCVDDFVRERATAQRVCRENRPIYVDANVPIKVTHGHNISIVTEKRNALDWPLYWMENTVGQFSPWSGT